MLDYDDYALAEHDRAECEASDRKDAMDALTDKKWAQIEQQVYLTLSSQFAYDDEFIVARTLKGKQVASRCCFKEIILEHIESERLERLLADLIATPAGAKVRAALAQLHAAAHAHNLAQAEMSE